MSKMDCQFNGHLINDTIRAKAERLVIEPGAKAQPGEADDEDGDEDGWFTIGKCRVYGNALVLPVNAVANEKSKRGLHKRVAKWPNGRVPYMIDREANHTELE